MYVDNLKLKLDKKIFYYLNLYTSHYEFILFKAIFVNPEAQLLIGG